MVTGAGGGVGRATALAFAVPVDNAFAGVLAPFTEITPDEFRR